MASGLVIHIEDANGRRTEVFTDARVRVGFGDDCDLRINQDLPPADLEIGKRALFEIENIGELYRISNIDDASALDASYNNQSLARDSFGAKLSDAEDEIIINDADELRFPALDLSFRFHPVSKTQAVVRATEAAPLEVTSSARQPFIAPFIEQAALDSTTTPRRDDAKVFLREFTRELVREISPLTKIMVLIVSGLLIASVTYLGYAMQRSVKQSRTQITDLDAQLADMRSRIDNTGQIVQQIDKDNERIRSSMSLAPKIVGDYAGGVCLISGTYMFVDSKTGRPLRQSTGEVERDDAGEIIPNETGAASGLTLTPRGNGGIAYFDFVGTGFHVGNGFILTNKHVAASPWTADERAQLVQGANQARPRMVKLAAYFPKRRTPLALRLRATSSREDLAVVSIESSGIEDLPSLPLETDEMPASIGTEVIMMGFPSGPERLLAIMPDDESRTARARYSKSLEAMLNYLSGSEQITPLITVGTVTDLRARRIVYDARTAEGGSGAPLFGQQGRVIGINFAVFTENNASNLAVPVRYALPLLSQAGWQPLDTNGQATNATAADTQQTLTKPTLSAGDDK